MIADLHVHSRFAMATSNSLTTTSMIDAAVEKGIDVISTGDILHKDWLAEVESTTEEVDSTGLYRLKSRKDGPLFILGAEISTVFYENGKTRKVHNCVLLPSIESVKSLRDRLSKYGKLDSDGRPTLMMSAASLVDELFSVEKNAFVFPAHLWTPYFGALGSISGFDSVKEAYADQEKHIYAIETGLSSNPQMNWTVSGLDKYALVSNSDMHSTMNMGREANVLNIDRKNLTYSAITNAIKDKDSKRLSSTIEFYPEEGKYHFDGHRDCHFSTDPSKTDIKNCRICGKPLVMGVMHRVMDLADRPADYHPKSAVPYVHIVPLMEVISYSLKKGKYSKPVRSMYDSLVKEFSTEFNILIDADINKIAEKSSEEIAEAIRNVREGKVHITPGYAGVFGKVDLLPERASEPSTNNRQKGLSDF